MLFFYKAIDEKGAQSEGSIEALNKDVAISSLQRRGLIIESIQSSEDAEGIFKKSFHIFSAVKNKDIVILSRQIATLFNAQVSALRIFRLLAGECENAVLATVLTEVADDIQSGSSISKAISKHDKVFSDFYVNMVKAGEESGKLGEIFSYMADYLDRNFAVTSKAKNALIYPAFVIITFIGVMVIMLTTVIPKVTSIIKESGQPIPIYTRAVIFISDFFVNYGIFLLIVVVFVGYLIARASRGEKGALMLSKARISIPYLGTLYRKLYLARISDNMNTMLMAGLPMVKVLEITSKVVDSKVYEIAILESLEQVKGGIAVSDAFSRHPDEIPSIFVQMAKIGEETGELGHILETLAKFYEREVVNAVDTMVDLIEPVMIVTLGIGVAFLLASVLIPIYNITASI